MQDRSVFEKYYARMRKEGILNALLLGVSIGGAVIVGMSLLCMFTSASLALTLALTLGVGIGVSAGMAVLLYFVKFKPTERKMADRADAVGLHERALTMLELQDDASYIATRQRADAAVHIARASGNALARLSVSIASIVSCSVACAAGGTMTTVSSLMAAGVIPPAITVEDPFVPEGYAAVSYMVEEGGMIEGEEDQLVLLGESAEPVTAVPDEGWAFKEWSDGVADPYRYDTQVTEDLTVTAIFEEIEGDGDGDDQDGEGKDSDDDSEKPNDNPNDNPNEPSDPDDPQPPPDDPDNPDDPQNKYEDKNQVIDGETYYRDVEGYYAAVVKKLTSGTELTQEERDFIEKYFGSI